MIFFACLLPSLLLAYLVYRVDRFREPFWKFQIAFCIGLLSPLWTLQLAGITTLGGALDGPLMGALFAAALPEELGRAMILVWLCRLWRDVDEPFDCVVYGAAIWAGFAATENLMYALDDPEDPAMLLALRTTLCTTGHTAYGAVLGAFVGMGLFVKDEQQKWWGIGLAITVGAHALYNGLLASARIWDLGQTPMITAYVVDAVMLAFAIFVILRMLRAQSLSSVEGARLEDQLRLMHRWVEDDTGTATQTARAFGLYGVLLTLCSQLLLFGTAYALFDQDYVGALGAGVLLFATVRTLLRRLIAVEANTSES